MNLVRTSSLSDFTRSHLIQVLLGIGLMFATSQASIPLRPIPINLATVGALLIGFTYAPRRAFDAFAGWILLGAAGLPMFANFSGGIPILTGPTAGYIFGMATAGVTMGILRERMSLKSFWSLLVLGALGQLIIFSAGIGWLSVFLGVQGALVHGFYPFILPGCLKVGILVAALRLIDARKTE